MKFNSQICTTREQSERLLKLGLKKETADMVHYISASMKEWGILATPWWDDYEGCKFYSPAWSLHRLMCLVFNSGVTCVELYEDDDAYETLIYNIEWLIEDNRFNKEFLEEKK